LELITEIAASTSLCACFGIHASDISYIKAKTSLLSHIIKIIHAVG
jgi:hypothetical protein